MTENRTHTEVKWRAHADETDQGHLRQVTLVRITTVYPVTRAKSVQWSQGVPDTDRFGPFPADQLPGVIGELTEMLTYYANGQRAKDIALEGQEQESSRPQEEQ